MMQLRMWTAVRPSTLFRGRRPLESLDAESSPIADAATFRRRAWLVCLVVLLVLTAAGIVVCERAANRRERSIYADVERIAAAVDDPHRDYLEPRIGLARQVIALLSSANRPGAPNVHTVARAGIAHVSGVPFLAYRGPSGTSWDVVQQEPAPDLDDVERRLIASSADDPTSVPAVTADFGGWGRTLVLRFPVGDRGADSAVIEAIRLGPLYEHLFRPELRASYVLQIYDESGLVWGEAGEPPASSFLVTRTFPVASQRWTIHVWPRPQWLAAERREEWWAIGRFGLPTAPVVAALVVILLLWWGRLTETIVLAESRMRMTVDKALDAVVTMDADGGITGWNAQAEVTFGWSRNEAIGRSLAETIIPPALRDAHTQGVTRFLGTGRGNVLNRRVEMTAWHRDGHEFPVELAISAIPLRDTYLFTAFVRDITDRRRAEEELRAAKDTAEAGNRAKSEFLATMSHEIRTPMNGIFGMTELALDTDDDDERRDFLVRARACAESLMTIINDVLDFSKIEAGKLDLECIEFDVRGVLDGVLDTLAIEANRKRLELVGSVDEALPPRLRGDPGRLRQILMNLAGNALKFTDHGEIVIRLERDTAGAVSPANGIVLRCAVQDTGIGIPREKQAAIFESFTQAHTSTTPR
jgi:PAS domain S-box-containing protein